MRCELIAVLVLSLSRHFTSIQSLNCCFQSSGTMRRQSGGRRSRLARLLRAAASYACCGAAACCNQSDFTNEISSAPVAAGAEMVSPALSPACRCLSQWRDCRGCSCLLILIRVNAIPLDLVPLRIRPRAHRGPPCWQCCVRSVRLHPTLLLLPCSLSLGAMSPKSINATFSSAASRPATCLPLQDPVKAS